MFLILNLILTLYVKINVDFLTFLFISLVEKQSVRIRLKSGKVGHTAFDFVFLHCFASQKIINRTNPSKEQCFR